jgi:calcineurin-like phosphoesterase family protein
MKSPITNLLSQFVGHLGYSPPFSIEVGRGTLTEEQLAILEHGLPELTIERLDRGYRLSLTGYGEALVRELWPAQPLPKLVAQHNSTERLNGPTFNWLHLSDVHFGHGDLDWIANQKRMLSHLVEDCTALLGNVRLDVVFVTGDIAFSAAKRNLGGENEYSRASAFFKDTAARLGVPIANWYFVPGNHDVARESDPQSPMGLVLATARGELAVGNISPDNLRLLRTRFANYEGFLDQLGVSNQPAHGWKAQIGTLGDLSICAIGLNSAFLANDDLDEGRLKVDPHGLSLLKEKRTASAELRFVLSHHPLAPWLQTQHRQENLVLDGFADVHLFGHIHKLGTQSIRSGTGANVLSVAAGAAHDDRPRRVQVDNVTLSLPFSHGYSIGRFSAATGEVSVTPRRWSQVANWYRRDVDATPDEGPSAHHQLRRNLARRRTQAANESQMPPRTFEPLDEVSFEGFGRFGFLHLASISGWDFLERNQAIVRECLSSGGRVQIDMLSQASKYFPDDLNAPLRRRRQEETKDIASQIKRDMPSGRLNLNYVDARLAYTLVIGGDLEDEHMRPRRAVYIPHPSDALNALGFRMIGINTLCTPDCGFWNLFLKTEYENFCTHRREQAIP